MNTKVRAYCYRESSDCFLPRDVLDVLDAPSHVRNGRLIVFAPTATLAFVELCNLVLAPRTARDLAVATGDDVDALVNAGMDRDRSVWALPKQGRIVASVFREHGGRTAVRVGEIRRHGGNALGSAVFVSDDEPEQVTEEMIDAAIAVSRDYGEDVDRETMWSMLKAALAVQHEGTAS